MSFPLDLNLSSTTALPACSTISSVWLAGLLWLLCFTVGKSGEAGDKSFAVRLWAEILASWVAVGQAFNPLDVMPPPVKWDIRLAAPPRAVLEVKQGEVYSDLCAISLCRSPALTGWVAEPI